MAYDVKIDRLPPYAVFDLKGNAADIGKWAGVTPPEHANRFTGIDGHRWCHIGPNHRHLIASLDLESALYDTLRPTEGPPDISIVCISDTQTFFRITGKDAFEVVSIGCPMDLHPNTFLENGVSFTEFFALRAMVLRVPDGFEIAVEQSFGDMIADYLKRATA